MVNRRGDAMRIVGREAEAVVLLEILIGSHTESERKRQQVTDNRAQAQKPIPEIRSQLQSCSEGLL